MIYMDTLETKLAVDPAMPVKMERRMDWKLLLAIASPVLAFIAWIGGIKVVLHVMSKRLDAHDAMLSNLVTADANAIQAIQKSLAEIGAVQQDVKMLQEENVRVRERMHAVMNEIHQTNLRVERFIRRSRTKVEDPDDNGNG